MSEPKKGKAFCIEEQKTILVRGDVDKETYLALAAMLGLPHSALSGVKNRKERLQEV
jgi:hypothetical protein